MTVQRPVLRWHGGKWRIAPWIIEQMPPHEAYVEPYGGGASVLLRKPRSRLEVYNDLDGEVVNLFAVLRSRPADLAEAVALTPFARAEFDLAYEPVADAVERARRFLVLSHMGFGSNAVYRRSGFRASGLRAGTLPVHNWADMPAVIRAVAERVRGVVIENRAAVDAMTAHDAPGTLHYVDPPYVMATRSDAGADYAHEMSDADHAALLSALFRLRGRVILSGYACPLYDDALRGWRRLERRTMADGARERTEVLWMNFEPDRLL
ncbi:MULTISPECIES: DNA adenine methylase [Paracoccus]|uniref:DNA adenine methylase n=1 Tax=Paracoccus TaxID=265 RepID=UPI001FB64C42|nr:MULTISPECIES: DNA adenine methylase [Paracoccus]MCJ1903081.1 DNA adenine methylase [Paracoccus versutus]MDF3907525.1 DNA adenine methylase [Paracoccus sp. AS002]